MRAKSASILADFKICSVPLFTDSSAKCLNQKDSTETKQAFFAA